MEGMNAHSPSSECHPTQVTIFGSVWFAVARITLEELGYHTTLKASRIEERANTKHPEGMPDRVISNGFATSRMCNPRLHTSGI